MGKIKEYYTEIWEYCPETLVDGMVSFRKIKFKTAYDVCLAEDTVIGAIYIEILGPLHYKYSFEPMPKYSKFSRIPKMLQKVITKRFVRQLAAYVFIEKLENS